jgi:hypothetical protein
MSKRIVISETEKKRIKSLYINEGFEEIEGGIIQLNVDGGLRSYKITDVQIDKSDEGKCILYTNQQRTNGNGGKWFDGKKQFYFDCTLPDLYGYDGRPKTTERYSPSENIKLEQLLNLLRKNLNCR